MRVTWFKDREIILDESVMSDETSGEQNCPDQEYPETWEQPVIRNSFSSRRCAFMMRLSETQQFIGKVQNKTLRYKTRVFNLRRDIIWMVH